MKFVIDCIAHLTMRTQYRLHPLSNLCDSMMGLLNVTFTNSLFKEYQHCWWVNLEDQGNHRYTANQC
jgi:hypothetical protein